MKALRIVQFALVVVAAIYLVLIHNANPTNVILPFAIPLPPALAILVALIVGWLVGWLPARLRAWRRGREIARLERRVRELEAHLPGYDREGAPVIPDRAPEGFGESGGNPAARLLRRGFRGRREGADRQA